MAAASGTEDEDETIARNTAAAMNQSIYLMVSVPYVLLGGVGYLIYRAYRKGGDQPGP